MVNVSAPVIKAALCGWQCNAMQRHVNFPVVGVSVDQCSMLSAQSAVHSMQLSVHSVHCAEVHMRACKTPSLGASQSLCLPHPGDNLIIMMQTMMRFVMVLGMRKESFRV